MKDEDKKGLEKNEAVGPRQLHQTEALRTRTTRFALRVIAMHAALPRSRVAQILGDQALRAGTSVGAQYREACRARSNLEVISKLESVLQELDEVDYWFELLVDSETIDAKRLSGLRDEANQLTAIFVTIVKKIKGRAKKNRS